MTIKGLSQEQTDQIIAEVKVHFSRFDVSKKGKKEATTLAAPYADSIFMRFATGHTPCEPETHMLHQILSLFGLLKNHTISPRLKF